MFRNVFWKTLYDQRRGLAGWSAAILILVGLESALWPSMRELTDLQEIYSKLPEELGKLFDLQSMTTGPGFLNAELFTLLLPALFLVYGIGHGARSVAGEEEDGTLDLLLVMPITGARIVVQKALALFTCLFTLGLALFVATTSMSLVFDVGISAGQAASGSLAMTLLGAEYGALALAVGAIFGRRSTAIGVASAAATAAYVLYAAGLMIDAVEPWRPLSPFDQALTGGPLGADLPAAYLWLVGGAAALVLIAMPALDGRDIAAHN
ncbi:ABC-2 type transport system permease protein [Kribbella orskensis]|uniref:ABC-2 type transport system permease protein n=1 Tax=Kribbella orskensis TaxID=2512216 RepID=A0ABY2B625_9ACTN|nr:MULTISPECIES: ABC transporter permease subunit [Kribbella]TCN28318.1 ABC-2 type transport system permease protein [Kribbella sp. VKM Ac-2500]TCO07612.1 ABC-2 type transport system permease protein [Kribbella orskensis]